MSTSISISACEGQISIGGISKDLGDPLLEHLMPPPTPLDLAANCQEILGWLRWMLQKDSLGQDMCLIGAPGPLRRWLAMLYCRVTQREVEYVCVTRDTGGADLIQRRELSNGGANFVDGPVVRAVRHGRLLVLEGLEAAERNVLPAINNLLENRELVLEDGCTMISADRIPKDDPAAIGTLIPVHPDFRVIALGVPPALQPAAPLDPPLRSRFQACVIWPLPPEAYLDLVAATPLQPTSEKLHQLLAGLLAVQCRGVDNEIHMLPGVSPGVPLPPVATSAVLAAARSIALFPQTPLAVLVHRCLPSAAFPPEARRALHAGLAAVHPALAELPQDEPSPATAVKEPSLTSQAVLQDPPTEGYTWRRHPRAGWLRFRCLCDPEAKEVEVAVPMSLDSGEVAGTAQHGTGPDFVATPVHSAALDGMLQSHVVGRDICLIGSKGVGKTAVTRAFARVIGQPLVVVNLYKDMMARDLLQRRATSAVGDTIWEPSPLMHAALHGGVVVLDGIDRLAPTMLSSLSSLLVERCCHLPDGSRLAPPSSRGSSAVAGEHPVFAVHPGFRVVALAEPPTPAKDWLHSGGVLGSGMFDFHVLGRKAEVGGEAGAHTGRLLLQAACPHLPEAVADALLSFATRTAQQPQGKAPSMRMLLRTARYAEAAAVRARNLLKKPGGTGAAPAATEQHVPVAMAAAAESLQRGMLQRFMPEDGSALLQAALMHAGFDVSPPKPESKPRTVPPRIFVDRGLLRIGRMECPLGSGALGARALVPSPVFHDIDEHCSHLESMLAGWVLGEHLLLIGNQGVGKNKLADRFLQLLHRGREYLQLHRDTTVPSLTVRPCIIDGQLVYEDSPLVSAARSGAVLMLDEVDKAPLEVVAVLRTLLVDGEMALADGRRLVTQRHLAQTADSEWGTAVPVHRDFRVIALANRPGFPFLGNDFFRELGDCFSTLVIDNPDPSSELALLRAYAPDVDEGVLKALVACFQDLRSQVDAGSMAYPYSTRELVALVKHIQAHPGDPMEVVLENVFGFEVFDESLRMVLEATIARYGLLPEGEFPRSRSIPGAKKEPLILEYKGGKKSSAPKHGRETDGKPHVGGNTWAGGTGGADTAGLGGIGGPYRLDLGHKVHEAPAEEKKKVSAEAREAAMKMNRAAFAKRLEEISMNPREAEVYDRLLDGIQYEITQMRSILQSTQATSKERVWMKQQMNGELDDARLVEGLAGEKSVFKRRADDTPPEHSPQQKPKRLHFALDCSASMYRFNGNDKRLDRELQLAIIIMEAFQGFEHKCDYCLTAHSGDGASFMLVDFGHPPANAKERLQVVLKMIANAQYCVSGDHTLAAAARSIQAVTGAPADDYFTFLVSDANLSFYGVTPSELARVMSQDPRVHAHALMLCDDEEARELCAALPAGNGHLIPEPNQLPAVFQRIFMSAVLKAKM
ncbi:hypothetical protein CYMTET_40279 [Cymbomonas tetramitiformis]|uniref:AAA+ ATPase domain-containing protein n=1 Tax=Cymbomonas tetramitiformis TaxID=36881 RepID=A0AAE0C9S3_9CHLO|nr:hypothetical protein CYMTET_40279 [Cymbomonas tetramitiformis]